MRHICNNFTADAIAFFFHSFHINYSNNWFILGAFRSNDPKINWGDVVFQKRIDFEKTIFDSRCAWSFAWCSIQWCWFAGEAITLSRHSYHSEAPGRGRPSGRCGQRDVREQGEGRTPGDGRHATDFPIRRHTRAGMTNGPVHKLALLSSAVKHLKGLINDHINYGAAIKIARLSSCTRWFHLDAQRSVLLTRCVCMSNFTPVTCTVIMRWKCLLSAIIIREIRI